MSPLIIGSTSLKHWYNDCPVNPKDLDLLYSNSSFKPSSTKGVEHHSFPDDIFKMFDRTHAFITPSDLYLLKLSHAEYDINWYKTVGCLGWLKAKLSIQSYEELPNQQLFIALCKFWRRGPHFSRKAHISLKGKSKDFFNSLVPRPYYNHDTLHDLVKFNETPWYKLLLKDGEEVLLDKTKWDMLTYVQKLEVAKEEIRVLCLERYLLDSDFTLNTIRKSQAQTIKRLCTEMSRGWFSRFIAENVKELGKDIEIYESIRKRSN